MKAAKCGKEWSPCPLFTTGGLTHLPPWGILKLRKKLFYERDIGCLRMGKPILKLAGCREVNSGRVRKYVRPPYAFL